MADTTCRGHLVSIKSNGENGCRLPVGVNSCYIGGTAECEVRLVDANVSDRHCLIKFSYDKQATIYSLCLENPVFLNGKPVSENGSALGNGDIIQIIDVKFRWEENDSYVETDLGRHSLNVEEDSSEEVERKRFSEPPQIFNRKNVIEDKQEVEPHFNCNNINANEQTDETKVTSETTLLTKSSTSSSVKTVTSSCENNHSNYNRDSQNQSENNSSKDVSQNRRSRQFCQTYKTKSATNTPDKKKMTPTIKSFFKNTPLQENNRTHGREVRSRFFVSRNSSIKPETPLSFVEASEKNSVQENEEGDSNFVVNGDSLDTEVENIVPKEEADVQSKEHTLGNEMNVEEATFETTVPSDMADVTSDLATPKCFTNAFHSTPKALELSKSGFVSNLEANETTNISCAVYGPDDPTRVYNLDSNSISASPVKSVPDSDVFCKKKVKLENSRMEPDLLNETRRHHTRSTSNILKRTFEECSEDNLPVGEKSLTTPEKLTNECSYSQSRNSAITVEESELDDFSLEKKVDLRKSVSVSIRSPMPESTSELSAENGDAVSSLSLEMRDKSQKYDDSSMMAKCSRNLSSFSPPENNKSQEYMDSVVVSTPKKLSLVDNEEGSHLLAAVATPVKDSVVDGAACMSTPKTPGSPTRHRRSTGIVPCVGTPSDVYRTTKGGLTPAHKSRFSRTSMEVEVSTGPRDSLSGFAASKFAPKRSSSERKSTPLKSDKSVVRDSLQLHSPIVEEYALECEESQNESLNNDSQFKFVSRRRRRLAKSSFAIEDRILEESEINPSDLSNGEDEVIGEESLVPLESFDENSEFVSTRIVVNQSTNNDTEDGLNSTYDLDTPEEAVDGSKLELTTPAIKPALPKSILTPLPRQVISVREKSAKKVTFFNVKEDSLNSDVSACTVTDVDSELDLPMSSSPVNSTTDIFSTGGENINDFPKNDSDDERLYMSDKSSDACSFNDNSSERSESIVQRIVAKRNKTVKRLSSGTKSKSPRLSGVRRLMNPPRSPKCDYLNVSGVEQLMKTPESLVKAVKKHSLLGVKMPETRIMITPESSKKNENTPESRAKNSESVTNRQQTPAPCSKRTKTPEALAECLSTPKALMELAKPPKIAVEFVETPDKVYTPVTFPINEVKEGTPTTLKNSVPGCGDSTFATPTMRRCSKHFRIHRSSICHSLVSSLNSTLNETLSPHDCSASLDNSVVEPGTGNTENESMPSPKNAKTTFKVVLEELKEKLRILQKRQSDADKVVLENSINTINKVLVDKPMPDSDMGVTEEHFKNVLLDLRNRYSYSEKSDDINKSIVEVESHQSLVLPFNKKEPPISSQSVEKDSMVAATGEASKLQEILDSFPIDEDIADASKSEAVSSLISDLTKSVEVASSIHEITDCEEVSSNNSVVKKSTEIQSSVSDTVEEILSNVCNGVKIDKVSKIMLSVSTVEEAPTNVSVAPKSQEIQDNVICIANSVETIKRTSDIMDSEETRNTISDVTSSVQVQNNNSRSTKSEDVSATDDFFKSGDAYHSTIEFETEPSALMEKESTAEAVDGSISELIEKQPSQRNSSIIQRVEEKQQLQTDTLVPNMGERQLQESIIEVEEQESDSQGLELFVSDSDDVVRLEEISTAEEKSESNGTISDVTKTPNEAVENTFGNATDSLSMTSAISSLPENCVEEIQLKNSITLNDTLPAEKVPWKSSCVDNSAVSNDTFKTCTPVSNLTVTAANIEEGEITPKIVDTIITNEKSKQFLDISVSLLVHEENKENLLSLAPIAVNPKEMSILHSSVREKERTPLPSEITDCNVTETQLSTTVADVLEVAKGLESSVLTENGTEENIVTSDKNAIIPEKSFRVEKKVDISLTSSYLSDVELDTTCEENLSCVEPSTTETETISDAERSINVTEELRMTITSCEADEEKTTDASTGMSQVSTESFEMEASSEACSTAQLSEVSNPVSDYAAVASVVPGLPDVDAKIMVTPPRSAAVCVSIETGDHLTFAGPKIVTQKIRNSAKSISTSTPIFSDVTQKTMEIPQSCSTTIDPNVSPIEDESTEQSSETIIDDEQKYTTVDSSACTDLDESKSKSETVQVMVQSELMSEVSRESQPTETVCEKVSTTDDVDESQTESASVSTSEEIVSTAVCKELMQENGTDDEAEVGITGNNVLKMPIDVTEKSNVEIPVKRPSRNLSVVLEDAIVDVPVVELSLTTNFTPLEAAGKNEITKKSSTCKENVDNVTESTRPKRGRPTKRYTESTDESSIQSSKRTKNTAKEPTSNNMNISVELERLDIPEKEGASIAKKRKTVHFNIEPEVKRPTKLRDLGKLYVPTPKRRRTESRGKADENSNASPPASDRIHQFGSPCSIVIRKMGRDDENPSVTKKAEPRRAPRSRSAAPKESVRIQPSRATTSIVDSADRSAPEPNRVGRAKIVPQILHSEVSTEEESQSNCETTVEVARKQKGTTKTKKNAASNRNTTEVANPLKEEKRSKRKAAEAVQKEKKTDDNGSNKTGFKGKNKNESSKTAEVLSEEAPIGGDRRTRRKAAEVVEKETKKAPIKGKKGATQSKDEKENSKQTIDAKLQKEVPAKEEKRSRRKVAEDFEENMKNDTKASKLVHKGKDKNVKSVTVDDSNSGLRATRQRKTAQTFVEAVEPPKTTRRAKVNLSTESATTTRATRSQKDAVETSKFSEKNSKSAESKTTVAPETSRSKAQKRTASVVLDSIDEVVRKKRKQSPDTVPVVTRTTRNKKIEAEVVVNNELRINLKKQKVDEKENKPPVSTKKAVDDEKPVISAANKKKRDPTPSENVRSTRTAKVKEAPKKEPVAVAVPTSRVTRSQNVPTLPGSRRAKK